ncbi:hypothetical protein [Candidatus Phycosocius spiralis]|uniref:hypothetical protein n=1 Tax=Candidatus Phycosocius spiralis TaxID=2815099 RepID=UPI0024E0AD3B|nr:hypothetical protein [Candidatus Phycosocius spiralis]
MNSPTSASFDISPSNRLGQHRETVAGGEVVRAFIPPPLPPNPPLQLEPLFALLDRANQALGRLDGMNALSFRHKPLKTLVLQTGLNLRPHHYQQ